MVNQGRHINYFKRGASGITRMPDRPVRPWLQRWHSYTNFPRNSKRSKKNSTLCIQNYRIPANNLFPWIRGAVDHQQPTCLRSSVRQSFRMVRDLGDNANRPVAIRERQIKKNHSIIFTSSRSKSKTTNSSAPTATNRKRYQRYPRYQYERRCQSQRSQFQSLTCFALLNFESASIASSERITG